MPAPHVIPVDASDNVIGPVGGTTTVAVAAGVGTTVVKGSPGRLCRVVVTVAGSTGALTFYDNATTGAGTVLAVIPGSATVGTAYDVQMPAANGIVAVGSAGSVGATVSFS